MKNSNRKTNGLTGVLKCLRKSFSQSSQGIETIHDIQNGNPYNSVVRMQLYYVVVHILKESNTSYINYAYEIKTIQKNIK